MVEALFGVCGRIAFAEHLQLDDYSLIARQTDVEVNAPGASSHLFQDLDAGTSLVETAREETPEQALGERLRVLHPPVTDRPALIRAATFDNAMPDILASIPADHGAQWADLNGDGAVDLSLTGQGPHAVLANILPDSIARRSLSIRVVDGRGHATRAGAEVRVYAGGTRRVLATRLADAGSGHDAQSDLPVHIGLPTTAPVDIEIAWPAAGQRRIARQLGVRLDGRRILEIRVR